MPMTILPSYTQLNSYKVLFMDTFDFRHTEFRVRAGTSHLAPIQRHAHDLADFLRALPEHRWNVIFLPTFWSKNGRGKDEEPSFTAVNAILALPNEKKPDLVVFHGICDEYGVVARLREKGQPAVHIPWDSENPSRHEREID